MRGQCNCKLFCRHSSFPIAVLYNGEAKAMKRYTTKHKLMGLSKCKQCEYITANKTEPGVKCHCCGNRLSRLIKDPRPKKITGIITTAGRDYYHTSEQLYYAIKTE